MRNHVPAILLFVFLSSKIFSQQGSVGVGTATADSSAVLDIKSNTKGLLIPRLSSAAISQINRPAAGLLVFDAEKQSLINYTRGGGDTVVSQPLGNTGDFFTDGGYVAQTFRVAANTDLHSILVALNISFPGTVFTVTLYEKLGVYGTPIDSANVTAQEYGNKYYTFNFTRTSIRLKAGVNYTFKITSTSGLALFYHTTVSAYGDGAVYHNDLVKVSWDLKFAVVAADAGKWQSIPKVGPAAWGVVYADGVTLGSNSGNFVVTHAAGVYAITFNSEELKDANVGNLPVNISLYGPTPGFITYTGSYGFLVVNTFDSNGVQVNRGFTFLVYRP
jgi:hypothetical protein